MITHGGGSAHVLALESLHGGPLGKWYTDTNAQLDATVPRSPDAVGGARSLTLHRESPNRGSGSRDLNTAWQGCNRVQLVSFGEHPRRGHKWELEGGRGGRL